jgi:alpha-L-rhamnosidase
MAVHNYCTTQKRRDFMSRLRVLLTVGGAVALGVFGMVTLVGAEDKGSLRAVDLRTEHQINPIGIDEAVPLVAWKLDAAGDRKPQGQQAYQIRVGRTPAALRRGKADLWDSGKIASSSTSNIPLTKVALQSRDSVAWQVRVWDTTGQASEWSAPATFEMGLLTPNDWTARWIENASYDYQQPDGKETPLPIFARAFPVEGPVAKARLYVTGLGMYAATLNGRAFSDHVLEPGQTTYAAEVHYRTYDLTKQLQPGSNLLRIDTGSGAYQRVVTPGRYFFGGGLEEHVTYGEPKVIAQLEITYADGRRQTVATDATWRTALGPTTFSSWWSGEEYDARRAEALPSSEESLVGPGWQNASLATLSDKTTPTASTPLRADPRPPIIVHETVEPVSIKPFGNGSYILDFGANRSGWPSLKVSGKAGTTVTLIPSELLNPDGSLNVRSTGASEGKQIAYRYTLAGSGVETWHPQFTYHGFRYLQVDGLPTAPTKQTVTMQFLYAATPEASNFESSSTLLQEVHAITKRALQSNMTSVLTDCPDREKGPYTGDNLHNLDTLLTDYDMAAYQQQLVRNMATSQRKPGDVSPGLIANITPEFHRVKPIKLNAPQGVIQFLDEVNWGGAIIRIPWKLYEVYGDTRTMTRYYDNMVAWLDYEAATKAANKGDIPGLGDWSASDNTTPMQLAILAGYYTAVSDMAKIAGVLGKREDRAKYTTLAEELAKEFNRRFRHTDADGVFYGSDSETSNAMALDAGLVPPADVEKVRARLVASVRRAGNHITTGSVGVGPLFRALEAAGRHDVLYDMVTNPTAPGYGYLVAAGYTTLPESFSGGGSQNHHFLGQVDAWLISGLAGIKQAAGSIAYRQVEIAPAVVGDLTRASGTYTTPQGTVRSAWQKKQNCQFDLEVTIPSGTTATVRVPAAEGKRIEVTGPGKAPQPQQRSATEAIYQLGTGSYRFRVMN